MPIRGKENDVGHQGTSPAVAIGKHAEYQGAHRPHSERSGD
jgi:hypothetical protein